MIALPLCSLRNSHKLTQKGGFRMWGRERLDVRLRLLSRHHPPCSIPPTLSPNMSIPRTQLDSGVGVRRQRPQRSLTDVSSLSRGRRAGAHCCQRPQLRPTQPSAPGGETRRENPTKEKTNPQNSSLSRRTDAGPPRAETLRSCPLSAPLTSRT